MPDTATQEETESSSDDGKPRKLGEDESDELEENFGYNAYSRWLRVRKVVPPESGVENVGSTSAGSISPIAAAQSPRKRSPVLEEIGEGGKAQGLPDQQSADKENSDTYPADLDSLEEVNDVFMDLAQGDVGELLVPFREVPELHDVK
ncbi:GL25344 [Drosophila persimilis]|uniref:GL25344 n=1 Tax=Drosophila persimilis TaxID=7234 RepID=B4GU28_DROPE|nr:GL25344 [Drosophila persimilis]